jgi:opacity protein-like surface antigen
MPRRSILFPLIVLVLSHSSPAFADATAFVGAHTNPERQQVRGLALGVSLLIVGFEGEYATAGEDETDGTPSLTTFSGNVFAQTPFPIFGIRPYVTTGVGVYREEIDAADHRETNLVFNTGGGAKISLIGPLRARLDYRVLKLRGDTRRDSVVHRLYAGVNLAF